MNSLATVAHVGGVAATNNLMHEAELQPIILAQVLF